MRIILFLQFIFVLPLFLSAPVNTDILFNSARDESRGTTSRTDANETRAIAEIKTNFETEKKEQENLALAEPNNRNTKTGRWLIIIIFIIFLSMVTILYLWGMIKRTNKKLRKKQEELEKLHKQLNLSKIEAGKLFVSPEIVDIKLLVEESWRIFVIKAEEKNIVFSFEVEENISKAMVLDDIQIRQVLVNLVGNAIKFTSGGYVKIRVYTLGGDEIHEFQPSKIDFYIDIEYTGTGIPSEYQDLISEPFGQIQKNGQHKISSTGLGLPISRRLMEMMGGKLTLKSEPGKGSVFTMHFSNIPVATSKSGKKSSNHIISEISDIQFQTCRLLIADDEVMNRSLVSSYFEGTEVHVFQAENGKEAIEMATKTLPQVILMDFNMPVMGGLEATKMLKQNPATKEIPVIAFSASNLLTGLATEEKHLFAGFITKPVFITELFEELSNFLPHNRRQADKG
jgi:two-component system sensor histidine kinase EvgS